MAKRKLTANEIKLAKIIFGDTIDYDKVRITNRIPGLFKKSVGGMCTGNAINTSKDTYCDDYDASYRKSFFIHEMTHIWQFQHSPSYLGKKLIKELATHHFNYMAKAYQYDLEDGKPFDDYGLEQQAGIVQDYFAVRFNKGSGFSHKCISKIDREEFLKRAEKILAPHFPAIKTSADNKPSSKPNTPK